MKAHFYVVAVNNDSHSFQDFADGTLFDGDNLYHSFVIAERVAAALYRYRGAIGEPFIIAAKCECPEVAS